MTGPYPTTPGGEALERVMLAAKLVIERADSSPSLLERSLTVTRASAELLLSRLEQIGVLGPADPDGQRAVLISPLGPINDTLAQVWVTARVTLACTPYYGPNGREWAKRRARPEATAAQLLAAVLAADKKVLRPLRFPDGCYAGLSLDERAAWFRAAVRHFDNL
jgi:hypothetical protein